MKKAIILLSALFLYIQLSFSADILTAFTFMPPLLAHSADIENKRTSAMKKLLSNFNPSSFSADMVFVPGGMLESDSLSKYVHSFYIDAFETTQEKWLYVMKHNPSYFSSMPIEGEIQMKRPVENVNWFDAVVYCNRLSIIEGFTPCYSISNSRNPSDWGKVPDSENSVWDAVECDLTADGCRLPTEAEWQFAADGGNKRCGFTYSGSFVCGTAAWYDGTSKNKTHQTGLKQPNALGLYDMSGNVWEWCSDKYTDGSVTRGLRGGSWSGNVVDCSVGFRDSFNPYFRNKYGGFRVVRKLLAD